MRLRLIHCPTVHTRHGCSVGTLAHCPARTRDGLVVILVLSLLYRSRLHRVLVDSLPVFNLQQINPTRLTRLSTDGGVSGPAQLLVNNKTKKWMHAVSKGVRWSADAKNEES